MPDITLYAFRLFTDLLNFPVAPTAVLNQRLYDCIGLTSRRFAILIENIGCAEANGFDHIVI